MRRIGSTPPAAGRVVAVAGRTVAVVLLCALAAVCLRQVAVAPGDGVPDVGTSRAAADVDRAWSWVRSMLRSPTRVESSTTLVPDREYPAEWTGPVRGTFTVDGVPTPPVVPAATAPGAGPAAPSDAPGAGGTYRGWEIRSFATTDRRHLVGVQPAAADGSFRFASSAPGTKTFQLVAAGPGQTDPAGRVLAEHAPATGVVRSAVGGDGTGDEDARGYAYDQALALQSALVVDDPATARVLVQGLVALQTRTGGQTGGFVTSAPQANPAGGEPVHRTGNTAIALSALLSYLPRASEPDAPAVREAAGRAVDWLLRQQLPTGPLAGLLTGGWDRAGSGPGTRLPFASTEHNLDAWQALSRAGRVLDCPRCTTAAAAVRDAILAVLWEPGEGRFLQGVRPEGPDPVEPLDVNSWGAIFLDAVGRTDLATVSLDRTAAFAVSDGPLSGYLAFRAQPTVPDPVPAVWLEGSFGVALARARHGGAGYADTMAGLGAAQGPDGSLPMASAVDVDRELSTVPSVAATTWFILASRPDHADALWSAP